jgi:hypothetical protein
VVLLLFCVREKSVMFWVKEREVKIVREGRRQAAGRGARNLGGCGQKRESVDEGERAR